MTLTFRCGHPREGNTIGIKEKRCRECSYRQVREHREMKAAQLHQDRNYTGYDRRREIEPFEGQDLDARAMPDFSRSLLTALYREHPYVFDAAERQGRLAVRP